MSTHITHVQIRAFTHTVFVIAVIVGRAIQVSLTDGLPDSALEKVSMAQLALTKLMKAVVGIISSLKAHRNDHLISQAYQHLADDLSALKTSDAILEGIVVLGVMPDKSTAGCSAVLL